MSVETVFIEVNLKTLKRNFFCKNYEHLLVRGDFNANIFEPKDFCTLFKLKNLVKEPTYKNPYNPSFIDIFLKELRNYNGKLFLCPPQK